MAQIRTYGDPVLRKIAEPITLFNDELRDFIRQLKAGMYESDGVGLAAPQWGESIRVFVIDPSAGEQEPIAFINPDIFFFSQEREDYDEGCLSVPGITLSVNRPSIISVRAFNEQGEEFTIEQASGLLSRVIQHETDHLNGILFVDRATPVRRQLISGKLKKLAKSRTNASKTL